MVCIHHPGRASVEDYGGGSYCEECRSGLRQAAGRVERWVTPGECFVTRLPSGCWREIREGGAAHWVAHELSARARPARSACLLGYALTLEELLWNRRELGPGTRLRRGDLWVDLDHAHCGLVDAVRLHPDLGPQVTIRHACPERGFVKGDDFYTHFMGRGFFYR